MLSAKKVRLHGMRSSRWTTKDKITQYKGLINLFFRDRKVLAFDYAVSRKKLFKELKIIRGEIEDNRSDLGNAIQGNRQLLRNTLAEHRDLQIAFQNGSQSKAIEHLHQGNFNKRKLLDRMSYQMKQRTEQLINLKLKLAELEDRLKYDSLAEIPYEKECQIVTGKVQDAYLKKEASLTVKHTYKLIVDILKKDSIYFDAVLATLKIDGALQNHCMMKTTELGQLATEYLDDRKQEFKELEKAVKRDMNTRQESLKIVREEVDLLMISIGHLIRTDTDINTGKVIIPKTQEDINLERDMKSITDILKIIQDTTFVSNFDCIYPCLQEQDKQRLRLTKQLEQYQTNRNTLINKKDHAEIIKNQLINTMVENTLEYRVRKQELLGEIENEIRQIKHTGKVFENKAELLVKVRSSLHQLAQKCLIVKSKMEEKEKPRGRQTFEDGCLRQVGSKALFVSPPPDFEENGLKIITNLVSKLQLLMNNTAAPLLEGLIKERAVKLIFQLTTETCSFITYEDQVVGSSLIQDFEFDDPQVPTYSDVKNLSAEVVEANTVNEDLVPVFIPKRK